jgi:phosphate transport system protein
MKKFEHDLDELRQRVLTMGNLTEAMVGQAIDAIFDPHNQELFDQVLREEERLDEMQVEIDEEAVRMMTIYSPVASDLRFLMSVTRINTELERIGDNATNMCEAVQLMVSKSDIPPLPEMRKMATVVREMVADSIDAFVRHDARKAQNTIAHDDMVDALNDRIIAELLDDQTIEQALSEHHNISGALAQLLIARALERIGDQATNISEEVIYWVKGLDIRHHGADPESGEQA